MFRLLMVLIIITVAGCEQGSERETYRDCMDELDLSHVPYPEMRLRLEMLHEIECQQEIDPGFEVVEDMAALVACDEGAADEYRATVDYCKCLYLAGYFDWFPCDADGINKTYATPPS